MALYCSYIMVCSDLVFWLGTEDTITMTTSRVLEV